MGCGVVKYVGMLRKLGWVGGDQVQDATMSHTWRQDAQNAHDANLTSPASGRKVDAWDAT